MMTLPCGTVPGMTIDEGHHDWKAINGVHVGVDSDSDADILSHGAL